jgi:hypothetical protein
VQWEEHTSVTLTGGTLTVTTTVQI